MFDASQAAAGAPVACGGAGGDANCLLLTTDLGGDSVSPVVHGTFFQFAELLIGQADGAAEPLLAHADTVITWTTADAGFQQWFSFGFPARDHVAWTPAPAPRGPGR